MQPYLNSIVSVILTTIGASLTDRMLHGKAVWYRLLLVCVFLEILGRYVAYPQVVLPLSFLLIIIVLLEVKWTKALVITFVYWVVRLAIIAWIFYRTVSL